MARPLVGLRAALLDMNDPVDDLKDRRFPVRQEDRPGGITVLAPDTVERRTVIHLGRLEQTLPGRSTAMALMRFRDLHLVARCHPVFPRG
ncbi:hypothetical protein ASF08_23450 [Methylobacterium sp. Leaf85]|nr:hypothetical protein ASF08_23450 [Methylobacterium sp. Leaf85]